MVRRTSPATAVLAATALPLLSLLAAAMPPTDIEAGEQSYTMCIGCHSPDRNRTGPLHCGVVGREAGSASGYDYSEAMRDAGIVWTRDELDRFLEAPLRMVPGTSMGFAGIADRAERRNLVAWLATLTSASPLCEDVLTAE